MHRITHIEIPFRLRAGKKPCSACASNLAERRLGRQACDVKRSADSVDAGSPADIKPLTPCSPIGRHYGSVKAPCQMSLQQFFTLEGSLASPNKWAKIPCADHVHRRQRDF